MGRSKAERELKRKAKKKKQLRVLNRPVNPRSCGECSACCEFLAIADIPGYDEPKPAGTACKHLTGSSGGRCGIYEDRPRSCQAYRCLWLYEGDRKRGKTLFIDDRPDKIGVMFDLSPADNPAAKALKRPIVVARPITGGAFEEPAAKKAFERLLDRGQVVVQVLGPNNYRFLAARRQDAQVVAEAYSKLPEFKLAKAGIK